MQGLFLASFVTSLGSGHALLIADGTEVMGGDAHFYLTGRIRQTGKFLSIAMKIRQHTPGRASVFNLTEYDLNVSGPAAGLRFAGASPQVPGVSSTVILERAPMGMDRAGWRELLERYLGADPAVQEASLSGNAASRSATVPVPKT